MNAINMKCVVCDKDMNKYRRDIERNKNSYCSRECYNNRRKENLKRLKRQTKFYDELLESSTCECGITEKYLLQIHHKDGNHNNNIPENLEIVCANCHIRRHLKINSKGDLVHHPRSLTKNMKLVYE